MTVQEGRTVVLYYQTRNDMQMTPDSTTPRGPWARQTQVWSSLLLFSSSVVTSLLGVLSVFAYAISTKTSNAVSSLQTKFGIAVEAVHVLIWVAVAAAYRLARNGNDLWGWSCSLMADNIQPTFEGVVNFGSVCDRSVCFCPFLWRLSPLPYFLFFSSLFFSFIPLIPYLDWKLIPLPQGINFDISIASSALQIASLFIWILVYKRMRTQKWLKKVHLEPDM
jgi:hypothetical protein